MIDVGPTRLTRMDYFADRLSAPSRTQERAQHEQIETELPRFSAVVVESVDAAPNGHAL
jgi:hypothetical protein